MRLQGVLLATFAVVALAQNGPQDTAQLVPIQGIVLERVSRTPIPGANVYASTGTTPNLLGGTADGGGRFEIEVPAGATFNLIVTAPGYQQSEQRQPAARQGGTFIEMTLARLAEIRGRLVDDATRKPVSGLSMSLIRTDILTIPMSLLPVRPDLTTQDDGAFVFKGLPQGDYYLRIQGQPAAMIQEIPAKDLAPETRDKALEVPEPVESYGIVVWPGDRADISQSPPLHVVSDVIDVGEIRLRHYKLRNLSGVLSGCAEGGYLQTLLLAKSGAATVRLADLDTTCGSGFRVFNLPEGSFTFVAQGGPPRRFVSAAINETTRGPLFLNVSPAASVQILIEVEGIPKENFPQELTRVNIALTPESAPIKIDAPDKVAADEYEAHLFGDERYRLSVIPPPAYYLKQLSYDGVTSADLTGFKAVAGSRSTLRLILSNHPGSVEAQAPLRSVVYLLKDGMKLADVAGDRRTAQNSGPDGKARFDGLSPGRYRAFLSDGSAPISQANIDAGLLHSADVTVVEGQTATVTLGTP